MTDPVKPEEKPVVLESPKAAEEVPTTSEPAPSAAIGEVAPAAADASAENTTAGEEKKEDEPEPKEITHGHLTKAHGGLLAFFKQKRFFYFQDEAISEDKLKTYLHKDTSSRSTAAYASQTGKGLLLYSKTDQKDTPHGIIKLADVTEVVPTGATKFMLKLPSNDLHFESTIAERNSWVSTLRHKVTEAKASAEEIVNSEGYKAAFEKLTKPTAIAAGKAPEKALEPKESETEDMKDTEAKPEKIDILSTSSGAEEEAGPADKKADVKRSLSKKNKRGSVFAFLDKKKKPEEKKEEVIDKKEEEPKEDVKPTETEVAPAVVTEASADAIEAKESTEADDTEKPVEPAAAPKPIKRNSIFGAFSRGGKEKEAEEKKDEKKEEVKSETAGSSEVVHTDPKPIETPVETTAAEKTPASSPPKPKFFPSFFDKKEKSTVKAAEKETEVKPAEATETAVEPTETTSAALEDTAVVDSTSPATSPKEQKRKSSFFSFKKEKKSDDVKSDSEDAEPVKSGSTPGFLGLMRKASKSAKSPGREADSKDVVAPETVTEEPTTVSTTTESTTVPNESTEPAPTIGDVGPETVNVGQAPVQATA